MKYIPFGFQVAVFLLLFSSIPFSSRVLAQASEAQDASSSRNTKPFSPAKKALFIYSYHPGFPTFFRQVEGIKSVFDKRNVMLDIEFMDTKRYFTKQNLQNFYEALRYKLSRADFKYDVVIVADDNALNFALEHQDDLFAGIPIVFCGVNDLDKALQQNDNPRITGVVEAVSVKDTIALILKLNPGTKRIYEITDNSTSGKAYGELFRKGSASFRGVEFHELSLVSMSFDELYQKLEGLGKDDAVMLLIAFRDKNGTYHDLRTTIREITKHLHVPLYFTQEHGIGCGVLGGKVINHFNQGRSAAELAVGILGGKPPASFPVIARSPNEFMFDFRILEKYKIPLSKLPPGSIILNKPEDFYMRNRFLINSVVVVIIALSVFIIVLMLIIRKLRYEMADRIRLTTILEATSDMVSMSDLQKNIIFMNKAGYRLLGIEEGKEDSLRKISDAHPDWAFDYIEKTGIVEAIKHGIWHGETALLSQSGEEIPASQVIMSHRSSDGTLQYLSTILRDLREIHKTEDALRHSEENLRITLDSIGDAVIATDAAGNIVRMNPVAENLTGWNHVDARGMPLEEVFRIIDIDRTACENPFSKIIEFGRIVTLDANTKLIARDGSERVIADSGAPIRNERGHIVGVVLVFRDISEQYRLEEQLRQSQKMESIGQLAGGIAHDFNNMLTGILGAVELLNRKMDKRDPLLKYVKIITDVAKRATDLTQKLLDFSRKGKVINTPVDIHEIISGAIDILSHSIDRKIGIETLLNAKIHQITGDPGQLQNVFLNMCINSRDAMPEGGTLTVKTINNCVDEQTLRTNHLDLQPGYYLVISIQDTGIGMDEHTCRRIFDPFFTTKQVGKGTGLGLSAVYGTIKDHHGAITVYSEPGKGSVFNVYFPVDSSKVKPKIAGIVLPEKKLKGDGTILIIDDEQVIRMMAKEVLTELGYEVILADNGKNGVDLYREFHDQVKLVFLDMIMQEMNGKETFMELRKIDPDVNVMIASGFSTDRSVSDVLDAGAKGFIKKPFTRNDLINMIYDIEKGATDAVERG